MPHIARVLSTCKPKVPLTIPPVLCVLTLCMTAIGMKPRPAWEQKVLTINFVLKKIGSTVKGVIPKPLRTGAILVGNKMDGTILPSIYFHTEPKLHKISNKILESYTLESWQFVYTPKFLPYLDKKDPSKVSIPTYVAESKDLVLHGIMLWRNYCKKQFGDLITEMVVLTDNGGVWKFDGGSLLDSKKTSLSGRSGACVHEYVR